ncbi:MAG TPA: Clp protease N-terminal domain-containing protein [Jatrophihabitans sp.]|jgi:ATP-dependent Clp protease ATP-binding subunit ClpA
MLTVARAEAGLARHGYVGLEHLLLTLTRPEAGATRLLLAAHGITTQRGRAAVRLVVGSGRGDGPRLDSASLLATLGIDLGQIRRHVQGQFGPDAIDRLYTSEVGWNLRPRGPLCDLGLSPQLKRAIDHALGRCWESARPQLHGRLLLSALDSDSRGLAAVFDELDIDVPAVRDAVAERLHEPAPEVSA